LWRLIPFLFSPGIEHELAQPLAVCIRKMIQDLLKESIISINEPIAPLFNLSKQLSIRSLAPADFIQSFPNGFRVGLAHQSSDILHLPPPGFIPFERLGKEHGISKILRHLYLADLT